MKYIVLNTGQKAIVDDEDYEKVNALTWTASKKSKLNNPKTYARHGAFLDLQRFIMQNVSEIPPDFIVRFINGDTLDCRKENLEVINRMLSNPFKNMSSEELENRVKKFESMPPKEKATKGETQSLKAKNYAVKKSKKEIVTAKPTNKKAATKQVVTNNFIGVATEQKDAVRMIEGTLKNITETWYISKFVDSTNREYVFGRYKTPREAAINYNKCVKLIALGLDEEVELNSSEILSNK